MGQLTQFSANLGFLWADRPLVDAIRAAKTAGFSAVECHWPYNIPTMHIKAVLEETSLKMLGLNTRRGNVKEGENGLSALPGREDEARRAIDEAIAYATEIGAENIHVMAGIAEGPAAQDTFLRNLKYACDKGRDHSLTLLIEPLNKYDVPGYFLQNSEQAAQIIQTVGAPNLKLMFDCYHIQRMEGDLQRRLADLLPLIGHIQFASVPDRGPPDHGEVNYADVFKLIADLGYDRPLGAEYRPVGPTGETLGWMAQLAYNSNA